MRLGNMNELTRAIREACEAIRQQFIANAIRCLPRRLKQVLQRNDYSYLFVQKFKILQNESGYRD